jgi:hypothetical protein
MWSLENLKLEFKNPVGEKLKNTLELKWRNWLLLSMLNMAPEDKEIPQVLRTDQLQAASLFRLPQLESQRQLLGSL